MHSGHQETVTLTYRRSASRLTIFAHVFGVLSFILMLVWLLQYRGGIEYDSYEGYRVFNVHPFLMFCGFIFLSGEAMMVYKTVQATHMVQKMVHMMFQLGAFVLGVVGICAVFKFHDMSNVEDVYSLHSWIGIATITLFAVQWLAGLISFMAPQPEVTKHSLLPWHICGGRTLLYMSIAAALTGLMEQATFQHLQSDREGRLVNFLGLCILLFGIFVDLSVALARYV
ncbi:hypothetical protein V6N13_055412 [Hibiscus sabdariffa]|uniref:Uncharacterized protein n=2 Tax=Hibiscus sabdariffa TaxID=183260 RepID=A0ABR2NTP0_9ROSI